MGYSLPFTGNVIQTFKENNIDGQNNIVDDNDY